MSEHYDPKERINQWIRGGQIVRGAVTGDITDPFTGERFVEFTLQPKRACNFIEIKPKVDGKS